MSDVDDVYKAAENGVAALQALIDANADINVKGQVSGAHTIAFSLSKRRPLTPSLSCPVMCGSRVAARLDGPHLCHP